MSPLQNRLLFLSPQNFPIQIALSYDIMPYYEELYCI